MRWFVIFLLLANIALYFWVQQQSRPALEAVSLTAPDVGHLRLLRDELATGTAAVPDTRQAQETPNAVFDVSMVEVQAAAAPAVAPDPVIVSTNERIGSLPVVVEAEPANSPAAAPPAEPAPTTDVDPAPPALPVDEKEVKTVADVENTATEPDPTVADVVTEPVVPETPSSQVPELPAVIETAVAEEADAANRPAMVCKRLGPLDDEQANDLIANLAVGSTVLNDATETYRQADSYYVMIPPLPSRAEGRAMLQRLNDAGISDTWLFRSGENQNAISLGLFSRKSGADRHAANVTGRGFTAEVRERWRELSGRFLVIGTNGAGLAEGGVDLPNAASSVAVDCPKP